MCVNKGKTCTRCYYCVKGHWESSIYSHTVWQADIGGIVSCIRIISLWRCLLKEKVDRQTNIEKKRSSLIRGHFPVLLLNKTTQTSTQLKCECHNWQLSRNQHKGSPGAVKAKDRWNSCTRRTDSVWLHIHCHLAVTEPQYTAISRYILLLL